jgi:hypothetical protein
MSILIRGALFLALWTTSAWGWGPHWDITRAAIVTLGANHVLATQLETELPQLTNYCWLPDFRRLPFRASTQDFYSDDYLLFPGVAKHYDHICPEVEQTYEPYLRRVLAAARMESPANAARWLGSLLHFIQDTGSPPHAAQIRGDVHTKMETWVDATRISIAGYEPKVLGTNDADAVRGLQERMHGLIDFSKQRAQRLRLPVLMSNRRAVEPIALESALECARVTADVLHTVGTLTAAAPPRGLEFSGFVRGERAASEGRFPAKLILHGTNISTLADSSGRFSLRGMAPGLHRLTIFQPGSGTLTTNILVSATATNFVFALPPSGDLVRNGNFSTHWIQTNAPDCWMKMNLSWEGEVIALQLGQRYRVHADFLPESDAEVVVRYSSEQPFALPKTTKIPPIQTRRLAASAPEFVFSGATNIALMQLTLRTAKHPTNAVRRISITPLFD